jgi:hypothetical protein
VITRRQWRCIEGRGYASELFLFVLLSIMRFRWSESAALVPNRVPVYNGDAAGEWWTIHGALSVPWAVVEYIRYASILVPNL